jgi:hypothetical protein
MFSSEDVKVMAQHFGLVEEKNITMKEKWYLLFDGESPDGRGPGTYLKRTTSEKEAVKHKDKCKKNPYSVGYVMEITDTTLRRL